MAISKDRITLTILFVVLAGGISAYLGMPRDYDPGFTIRTAVVVTFFPGASPERVEQLVTDKLEKVIQEIPELDVVRSESSTGASVIWVDVQPRYMEMRPIWDDLRRKVDKALPELPDGVSGPFVDDEFGDVFGIVIGITGDDFTYVELKEYADEARDEFLLIDEVAKVEIYGAQEERIFVEYNNARLSELGFSPIQLRQILEAQNIINPGGDIRTEFEEIVLEPSGNFETLEEVQRTVINVPGRTDLVYLRDVAEISRGYVDPPRTMMRASGSKSLGLAVSMIEGGNIITLGERVRKTLARIQSNFPIGIEFELIQFQPEAVDRKINEFVSSLFQAVAIVSLVMLLTLGLRTGLVVASLIPMAIVSSFLIMSLLDIGLDQMSLAALIIALGMLVDNAIVMSESIMVQMAAGRTAVRAAIDSAAELRVPLLTSSLTTAAAFLPIFLAESEAGEYTSPIFKVVTITLLCSWLLSLTVVPLLCVKFLRVKARTGEESYGSRFYAVYRAMLLTGLRHGWLALAGVVLIFGAAIYSLMNYVPQIFFPPNDRPTFTAEVELPVGTPIRRTEAVVTEIEEFIQENLVAGSAEEEGVTNWAAFIGQGAPRFILVYFPEQENPEYAVLLLNTTSREVIEELIPRLETFTGENFPDLKATIRPLDVGPPAWPPIQVRISGREQDRLFRIVDDVKAKLRETPGAHLIDDDWGARSKKLMVKVNQPRARRAGVTSQDVAISLQAFLSGLEATDFREDDKLIPVTLRSVAAERQDVDKLESLNVYAQSTGRSVPLKQVADIEVGWQPSKIKRYDRLKTVTVEAALRPGVTAVEVNARLRPWLDEQAETWGLGYSWEFGGEAESSGESNDSINAKLPIAALIIVLLLVAQFNSIRRPTIVLLTIPLSVIGVVFGLIVARSYFGFMTLLGIIALAGIVINNGIVLLDRIKIEIESGGRSPARAVIESAQRRLRPIVLSTVTTVGGLIPLWLGGGVMYRPMAIAIIFGLAFATVLTLGVVPILYSIFFRVSWKDFSYPESP